MLDSKSILLVNDLPGFGKVALGAMIPILSAQGHLISNLPTALVSNTLDYGIFEIPYKNIPIKLPGTGDIFTAVTLDNIIRMKSLEEAAKALALKLYAMINRVQNSVNRNFGLPIEDLLFTL